MTQEELNEILKPLRDQGASDEDIAKMFALAFKDDELSRHDFDVLMATLGYHPDEKAKEMSDEELKETVIEEKEPSKEDPDGNGSEEETETEEKEEEKEEEKSESESEEESKEEETEEDESEEEEEEESEEEDKEPEYDDEERAKALKDFGF